MSTVTEHVARLAILRQIWRATEQREPDHRDLMLDFEFKLEAARLCAVHLDELLALTGQNAAEATGSKWPPDVLIPGESFRRPGIVCGRCGCPDLMATDGAQEGSGGDQS